MVPRQHHGRPGRPIRGIRQQLPTFAPHGVGARPPPERSALARQPSRSVNLPEREGPERHASQQAPAISPPEIASKAASLIAMRIICSLAPRGGGAGRPGSATAGLEAQQRDLKAAGMERTFAEQTSSVGPQGPGRGHRRSRQASPSLRYGILIRIRASSGIGTRATRAKIAPAKGRSGCVIIEGKAMGQFRWPRPPWSITGFCERWQPGKARPVAVGYRNITTRGPHARVSARDASASPFRYYRCGLAQNPSSHHP